MGVVNDPMQNWSLIDYSAREFCKIPTRVPEAVARGVSLTRRRPI